jgi:hypothetical protein
MKWIYIILIVGALLIGGVYAFTKTDIIKSFNSTNERISNELKGITLNVGETGDTGNTEDKCIEVLVKTSDNIPSKIPRELWTQKIIDKDAIGSGKVGNIIRYENCGFEWGNMEKDPKNFLILRMNYSQFNESLLEPKYDTKILKENEEQKILKFRKYTLNLSAILNTKELLDLVSIKYNEAVNWNIEKNLTYSLNEKIINNNLNRTYDVKHGSAGTFTICASGCNYTNLQTWETAQDSDLTGAGNCTAVIMGNFNDTGGLIVVSWTTTINDWIVVIANVSTYRANATYDPAKFNLIRTDNTDVSLGENYIHIDGIQMEVINPTGLDKRIILASTLDPGDNQLIFSNLYLRGSNSSDWRQTGINIADIDANVIIYNTVVANIGFNVASYAIRQVNGCNKTLIYSTTVQGGAYGIGNPIATCYINIKDTIIFNQSLQSIYPSLVKNTSVNYVSTNDSYGVLFGGTGNRANQSFGFTDWKNGDFHLLSTDTGALNLGTDLSSDGNYSFTTDIDGQTRTGTWDIGCDEIITTGATTCTYPSIDNWAINCADNCNLTSEISIVNKGNVTLTGSGTFNVQSGGIICFSDTGQYVNVNSGCSINIESGGSINKVGTCIPP